MQGKVLLSLLLGEVVDLGPVIVPRLQPLLRKLLGKFGVDRALEGGKLQVG